MTSVIYLQKSKAGLARETYAFFCARSEYNNRGQPLCPCLLFLQCMSGILKNLTEITNIPVMHS